MPSVVDPEQAEIEAAIAASLAQAESEDKAAKNADELLLEKLKEMRKVKPKVEQKKKKIPLKHLYHSSFFYKILGIMDFYSSLAQVSPAALALVQQLADPRKLNVLLQFMIGSLSRGKIIALRILQALMKLDFPIEIFDRAVEISCKNAQKENCNPLDLEVKEFIDSKSKLDLSTVPFFKLIYSMILKVQEMIWTDSLQVNKSRHVTCFELTRVFKSLPQNGEKNIFMHKHIQSKINEVLMQIETCSGPEMETIMSIINESSPN